MAWSRAAITAALAAKAAADKPLLLGNNRAREATSIRWNTTRSLALADQSAAGTLTSWVCDGFGELISKPSAAAATQYLMFDFGANVTFDSIFIMGPSLGTSITAWVADNNAFSTNPSSIQTLSFGSSAKRAAMLLLGGDSGYVYTAQYLALAFAASPTIQPFVAEVFVSARRQLAHQPLVPWDPSNLRTIAQDADTDTGIRTRTATARGRRHIDATLFATAEPYASDLENWFHSDIRDGLDPFVWIDKPGTAPHAACMMMLDAPELSYPYTGPLGRELDLVASEQGPYFLRAES